MKRFLFILFGLWSWWGVPPLCYGQTIVEPITYSCWFDEDYSSLQTGTLVGNQFVIDVNTLSPGFHSLNVQMGTDSSAQLHRFLFYRINTAVSVAHAMTYNCWFDEDYSSLQSGNIGNGMFMLDVSELEEGFHSVNVQFGEGNRAQLTRYIFYRMNTTPDATHATTYSCWFDEDYTTLQTGNIGNGVFMLDVSNMDNGFHSVNVQVGEGNRAQLSRYLFYKTERAAEPTGPITYTCWFDKVDSVKQSGMLTDGVLMLDISELSDSNHTLFLQIGEGDNAQLISHIFWMHGVHEIQYSDNISHGSISITSSTDTILGGHFVFDGANITITTIPGVNSVLQSLTVNGVVVQSPYQMTVTDNVTIEASFVHFLPDLQATEVSVPDTISNSQPFTVRWKLSNNGVGNINNEYVVDHIMYGGTLLASYSDYVMLSGGDSIERETTVVLPCTSDTVGTLCIVADVAGNVEEDVETNNTGCSLPFVIAKPLLTPVSQMIPASDSVIIHGDIILRWGATVGATEYRVFLWPNGQQMPQTPTYTTTQTNLRVSDYENNQIYLWKVVSVNGCDTATSNIQHFAVFKQPKLTVGTPTLAFGNVEYNATGRQYLLVTGRDLTDSIHLSLHGVDSSMFDLVQQVVSRYGGYVEVTFTPTIMQWSFNAYMLVQSGALRDTVWLNGQLASYYNFTASVPDSILPPATPVPITGSLTNAANVPQANVAVDIWVTVMGRTTIVTDTTDAQGQFGCTYTPVMSECGYYEVGACLHGGSNGNALTTFNIPGISINVTTLPTWEVVQYDTVTGSIPVRNRCGVTLHDVTIVGSSLPDGLNVEFDTLTLAPFQEDSIRYTIVSTVRSTGTRYENVRLVCTSTDGTLAQFEIKYYCHKPIPNLQISFDSLYCSVVPGTQRVVDVALFNNTDSTFNKVQIQVPDGQSVIQLLQRDTAYSIAPHDSLYVHLLVSVPEDASWGIATGGILVTADNTLPQYIPYTINPVSDGTGSLIVLVSNEFTYYNNGPHVSGATVTVVGYYSLDTVAVALTGDDGYAIIDSLPEGYYKIHVSAPDNCSYSKITRVLAGEATYLDIDLEYEAITTEWIAYQVDEEDNWDIVLNTEFKTNVPKPVITIDIPVVDVPLDGSMGTFDIIVSNHGLIDSYDATLIMPESSQYEYFPLFDKVDTMHALSSIVIPCGVRDRSVYNSIVEIRNRGNYYIDTLWSVTSQLHEQMTYSDSTILIPIGRYFDETTGEELWQYDTAVVSIPHYQTISVLDSSISHVIYRDASTSEVLLDIDMDPQAEGDAKRNSEKIIYISNCEKVPVDMAVVFTWWLCDTATRDMYEHARIPFRIKTMTKCQVDIIIKDPPRVPRDGGSGGPVRDCPPLFGWLCASGGPEYREIDFSSVDEGCKTCKEKMIDIIKTTVISGTLCAVSTTIETYVPIPGLLTVPIDVYCSDAVTVILAVKELLKCFGIRFGNDPYGPIAYKKTVTGSSTEEEYKRMLTLFSQYYYNQQSEWYRMVGDSLPVFEEYPKILSQIVYYLNTSDSATVEGLAQCYDTTITVIDINTLRQYADRWNRTLTYYRYGWTTPEQVLSGLSQDFYYPDTNNIAAILSLDSIAKQEGYEDMEDLLISTLNAMKDHKTKTSTCAKVSLQLKQNVAMTREAFEGQLKVNNPNDTTAIREFVATFTVTDTLGHDYTDRFDIRVVSLDGIDSAGNIAANSSATITVRFVPLMSAAPMNPVPYMFGGEISYINPFSSLPKYDELNPVHLTVNPSPHLQFDYFVPHDIIADDPLTSPVIETSVPATIGMRLLNDGKGVANNVRASSISPQITENRQGLVVDFSIFGTLLDGENTTQPLNDIELGTISPNGVHTFEYSLLSSLLGTLTVKDINVIHNSSIDDKDMSLVDARAHRLVKPILQYGQGVDAIHDFLTDDIGNGYNLPDSLFFSDGTQTAVHLADTTIFDHYVEPLDTVVLVTLYPDTIGWIYGETDDPGRGKYEIVSCVRDDNTEIPLENIWLTFVDLLTGEDPVYVNKLHLVDTLSVVRATNYNVTFRLLPQTLDVDTILNIPSTSLTYPLDSVVVVFNKPIIDSTFSYEDMSLKCNNGANLMDSTVAISRINDSTFSIDVSQKNSAAGLYVFNVMTDSIVDATGRYGNGGKEARWIRTSCAPVIVNEALAVCDSLMWRDSLVTSSGIYYDTLSGVNGCDTVIILALTVNNSSTGDETVTACNSFIWHNVEYTTSTDSATFVTENAAGCDSVTTLHLTINYCSTTTITACDSYTWHGEGYTASGTYIDGNDTLILTINHSTNGDTSVVVCDTYNWYEHTALTTGSDSLTHIFAGVNQYGCDSTVTLHLTVNYSNTGIDEQTACDSYTWIDGETYTASNSTAQQTLTNVVGCDSVVTLNLTVNYSSIGIDEQTSCDSYTWIDGEIYTASNSTAQHTLTNVVGCDSVVTLNLTVNYSSTGIDEQTACDSYTWIDGETYTVSNSTAQQTFTNAAGCDSVVTLNLTVNYSSTGDTTAVACDYLLWWNTIYPNSTDKPTHVLTNAAGCDSTVTLHLTVYYSNTGIETVTACDSYTWIDGETYTASNSTAQQTLTNAAGCDSTVTLHLTVNYSSTDDTTAVACDSFNWWNTGYTNSTDEATQVFTNAAGCDSTVTLHLTVNYSSTGDTSAVACDSFTWQGTTYTAGGSPAYQTTNAAGCDSVVTLNLTVNYSSTGDTTAEACDSFTWHGTTYTAGGSPAYQTTNAAGCDSVITLNLTVNYSSTGIDEQTACDSYTWIDGETYTASNSTAQQTLTNSAGCDSVVTLNLTINYSSTGDTSAVACDSFTWWNTDYTNSTDDATQVFTNAAGCDSTVTLNLTINNSTTATETVTECDSYTWHGTTHTASGTDTYATTNAAGCDSTVTLNLTINNSTTATEAVTECDSYTWHGTTYTTSGTDTYITTNAAGCDSTVTLNLTINNSTTATEAVTECDSYTWHGQTYTSSTNTPTYTTQNAVGCDSTVTLNLTINYGVETTISDTVEGNYTWNGTAYTESGTYQWQGTTTDGCDSTVTLLLVINSVGVEVIDGNGVTVNVHPNPTTGWITIDADDVLSVEVYDQTGRHIATHDNTNRIDLGGLAAGNYMLTIHLQRGNSVQRVILK